MANHTASIHFYGTYGAFGHKRQVNHMALLVEGGRMGWDFWALGREPRPPGTGPRPRHCGYIGCANPRSGIQDLLVGCAAWVIPEVIEDDRLRRRLSRGDRLQHDGINPAILAERREAIAKVGCWPLGMIVTLFPEQHPQIALYLEEFEKISTISPIHLCKSNEG